MSDAFRFCQGFFNPKFPRFPMSGAKKHPAMHQGTPSSPPCAEKRVPVGGTRSDPDFQQLPRPSKPSHKGFVTDSVRMKMCVST